MIQVIVLNSELLCHDEVKFFFAGDPDICVTGEATNRKDFVRLLVDYPADVVLMDVNSPEDRSRVEVVCRIRRDFPALKILVVAGEGTTKMVRLMRKAGINGYIGREQTTRKELQKAIRKVAAGEQYIGRVQKNAVTLSGIRHKIDNNQTLNKSEIEYIQNRLLRHFFKKSFTNDYSVNSNG